MSTSCSIKWSRVNHFALMQSCCLRLEGIISPGRCRVWHAFPTYPRFDAARPCFELPMILVWLLLVQIDPFELSILSLDTQWLSPYYDGDPLHLYNANSVPNLHNKIWGFWRSWLELLDALNIWKIMEWFLYGCHYTNRDALPRSQIGSHFINHLSF